MRRVVFLVILILIPLAAPAILMNTFDEPLQGLSDNTVIDIVTHKNAVWLATNRGVSFTKDGGINWSYFDKSRGLISDEMSAIYSDDERGRLWIATNHTVGSGTDAYTYADGLSLTDNEGIKWDTMMVPGSYGPMKVVYDIAGVDSIIFCASWAGGLFGSWDHGETWRHIYYSLQDSVTPTSPTNLYFSAVIDTFHTDSMFVWAGTAYGLMNYIFAPPYSKPFSNYIYDIAAGDSFIYICGDSSFTRLDYNTGVERYHSSFVSNGLPGRAVSSAIIFGRRLFVGTLDSLHGSGTGLAVSDDEGLTFSTIFAGLNDFLGPRKYAREFASIGKDLFMAGYEAGLLVTSDTGASWHKIYIDSQDTTIANGRNIVHSLEADSFDLWVGTDSGLVKVSLDMNGAIDSVRNIVFLETDSTGARSYRVRIQKFRDSSGVVDSAAVWTINHAEDTLVGVDAVYRSHDYGLTWETNRAYLVDTPYYDIGFINSSVYLVGKNIFNSSPNAQNWYPAPASTIADSLRPLVNLSRLSLNTINIHHDTIYIGSEHGFAVSPNISEKWHVVVANTNLKRQDRTDRFVRPFLPGTFVTALGLQPLTGGGHRIWANCRVGADTAGFLGVAVLSGDGPTSEIKDTNGVCWNFGFSGEHAFMATDAGLMHSPDAGRTWNVVNVSGTLVNFEQPVPYNISPGSPVYAAKVINNDTLWVGTGDGAAKIAVSDLGTENWSIFRVYDPTQNVYAYPVPFSASTSDIDRVTFHYPVPRSAYVTLSVYDFAMNLVKRVVNSEWKEGGDKIVSSVDRWDGHNGKGDIVAAGIYYFKVELSTGERYWGKLAIIP